MKVYTLGIYTAISNILLLAVLLFQDQLIAQNSRYEGPANITFLRTAQLFLVLLTGFAAVSIPRRPDVFYNGNLVNGMRSATALSRYSFSWAEPILATARKNQRLNFSDLSKLSDHTRSKDLSDSWNSKPRPHRLYIEIFLAHKTAFLTIFQALGI